MEAVARQTFVDSLGRFCPPGKSHQGLPPVPAHSLAHRWQRPHGEGYQKENGRGAGNSSRVAKFAFTRVCRLIIGVQQELLLERAEGEGCGQQELLLEREEGEG